MGRVQDSDLLAVVGCQIDRRPAAPSVGEIASLVLASNREEGRLCLEFPLDARERVEAFAAAERVCCPGITWEVEKGASVRLWVTAGEAALDVISGAVGASFIANI